MIDKEKPRGRTTPTATQGRADRVRSHSIDILHQNPDFVKPKIVRYRAYSERQSTWAILGPMLTTARALGLVGLVDDLLELGRSWQARGVAA